MGLEDRDYRREPRRRDASAVRFGKVTWIDSMGRVELRPGPRRVGPLAEMEIPLETDVIFGGAGLPNA